MLEINIDLKPSKQFIFLMIVVIVGSLGNIYYVPLSFTIKLLLTVFTLSYGGFIIWKYGLLTHPHSIVKLVHDKQGWQVREQRKFYPVKLSGDSTLTTHLCVLRFIIPNKRFKRSCVIFKDAVEQDQYRKLLIALRS